MDIFWRLLVAYQRADETYFRVLTGMQVSRFVFYIYIYLLKLDLNACNFKTISWLVVISQGLEWHVENKRYPKREKR